MRTNLTAMNNITRTCFRVFLLIFFTANGYILLSGSVCFWLANRNQLSAEQTRMFNTCEKTWNQGTNTIFRLLDHQRIQSTHQLFQITEENQQ